MRYFSLLTGGMLAAAFLLVAPAALACPVVKKPAAAPSHANWTSFTTEQSQEWSSVKPVTGVQKADAWLGVQVGGQAQSATDLWAVQKVAGAQKGAQQQVTSAGASVQYPINVFPANTTAMTQGSVKQNQWGASFFPMALSQKAGTDQFSQVGAGDQATTSVTKGSIFQKAAPVKGSGAQSQGFTSGTQAQGWTVPPYPQNFTVQLPSGMGFLKQNISNVLSFVF